MARVLVADDDPAIRDLACLLISERGHQVMTAEDGLEAIALLETDALALVVTDYTMPMENGLGVCRAVRSSAALARIPLVLLTALPLTDERVVHASAENNALVLSKTEIGRLGEIADRLVSDSAHGRVS